MDFYYLDRDYFCITLCFMRRFYFLVNFGFFLFLAGASLAAAQPLFPVGKKELSPLKDMVVSYYPDCGEIWLIDAHHPKNAECLLFYIRSADVLLSPKETALIDNERPGSNPFISPRKGTALCRG